MSFYSNYHSACMGKIAMQTNDTTLWCHGHYKHALLFGKGSPPVQNAQLFSKGLPRHLVCKPICMYIHVAGTCIVPYSQPILIVWLKLGENNMKKKWVMRNPRAPHLLYKTLTLVHHSLESPASRNEHAHRHPPKGRKFCCLWSDGWPLAFLRSLGEWWRMGPWRQHPSFWPTPTQMC